MSYSITWEPLGVYAKFSGSITIKELLQGLAQIVGDHRLDNLYFVIVDYLDVEAVEISKEELPDLAAQDIGLSATHPRVRFASITKDEKIRELWRHYSTFLVLPARHRLFENPEQGRAWVMSNINQI